MKVEVNRERARELGKLIAKAAGRLKPETFEDPRYYPPRGTPRREVMAYFLVMVAMDHRLSRGRRQYEAEVNGERFHGADLLYRLGSKLFAEDPGFFTADRLARVSDEEVLRWLTVDGARPPDAHVRAELLRDLGLKLKVLFDGDPYRIVLDSGGYLRRGVNQGFIDLLKVFKAYQDPVEKKAFLLAKFIERREVVIFQDPQNKEVPVDNHLTRIALRTGIVDVDSNTLELIAAGHPFRPQEDVMLRLAVREAYRLVAQAAGVDPFIMDDFLWSFGRSCCTFEGPSCVSGCSARCSSLGGCDSGECILAPACRARSERLYMVPEHNFMDTWWY